MYDKNPWLFISYLEKGTFDAPFADYLELRLRERGVFLYGLVGDRRVGSSWRKVAAEKMREADGVLVLWTHGAAKSAAIRDEVAFVLDNELEVCLMREPLVDYPNGWDDEKLSVKLRGVDPLLTLHYSIFSKYLHVVRGEMTDLLDEVSQFAWRAYGGRPKARGKK